MEERAARFAIGPAGQPLTEPAKSRVALTRQPVASFTRRSPRGATTESRVLFSTYAVLWDFEMGDDAGSLDVVLAALCDPEHRTLGNSSDVAVMQAGAEMEDGSNWILGQGLLRDFQIVVQPRGLVEMSSTWEFGTLREGALPVTFATDSRKKASGVTSSFALGAVETPFFAGTLAFTRDASPAGFSPTGDATGFSGRIAVDVVGRFNVRLPADSAFAAVGDQFTDTLTAQFNAGQHDLRIVIPNALFRIKTRRLASDNLIDYQMEMLAVETDAEPIQFFSTGGVQAELALPVNGALTIDGVPLLILGTVMTYGGKPFAYPGRVTYNGTPMTSGGTLLYS